MSKERELLEKVLAFLETDFENDFGFGSDIKSILAQPEQEPDYYLWHNEVHEEHPTNEGDPDVYPLYASPPKREPSASAREMYQRGYADGFRAIEKAHGIGE